MLSSTLSSSDNVSEMLVHISGDLLKAATSREELQARLNMLKTAWNISLYTRDERKLRLKAFIRTKKDFAPSRQALKNLESELKQIIKQKVLHYPGIDNEIVNAEAFETGPNAYEIKAFFKEDEPVPTAMPENSPEANMENSPVTSKYKGSPIRKL